MLRYAVIILVFIQLISSNITNVLTSKENQCTKDSHIVDREYFYVNDEYIPLEKNSVTRYF
jgi:hypothetical protein